MALDTATSTTKVRAFPLADVLLRRNRQFRRRIHARRYARRHRWGNLKCKARASGVRIRTPDSQLLSGTRLRHFRVDWGLSDSGQVKGAEPLDAKMNCPDPDRVLAGGQFCGHPRTARGVLTMAKTPENQLFCEQTHGPEHPNTATALNNLGLLLQDQERYQEAEQAYLRAGAIDEKAYGPESHVMATDLSNLGGLYIDQERDAEAVPLLQRALELAEQAFGPDHPLVSKTLNNLASAYDHLDRREEAEQLYVRSLRIDERVYGQDHPQVAIALNNLATSLTMRRLYQHAEPLFQRSLAIREKALGPHHPATAAAVENLAYLYRLSNRPDAAAEVERRAEQLRTTTRG